MPESNEYYTQLLADYLNNNCTPQQVDELMLWLQQDAANRMVLQQLQAEFNNATQPYAQVPAAISNRLRERLMHTIQPPVTRSYKRLFFRVAAAAIFILLLGAGWFFLLNKKSEKDVVNRAAGTPETPVTKRTGAYITLANGQEIALNKSVDGVAIYNINVKEIGDNRISYDTAVNTNAEITYHTLTVPPGIKMVQVTLADGSLVYLNTASSLKYPTAFTGNERSVELTGEAYFDVKHDAGKPFAVRTNNITINVLGTGFNVSAYEDDDQTDVVLVKGSVALSAKGRSGTLTKQLTPGNMASFQTGAGSIAITAVKTDEYVSWTKGYLIFRQAPLEQIVKRISRYYNVRINTSELAHSDETFSGRLDLQKNIDDIMNLICLGSSYIYLPKEQKLALKK
jgi:ferric-dicitrate binding protein FerR (iron transport regulator)